jgi:acetyl esterase/lipase
MTTTEATTTAAPASRKTSNVVYMTVNGADLMMDVYVPTDGGSSPVVVSFHGQSELQKGDLDTVAVAKEAASDGMVVFVPSWFYTNPIPLSGEKLQVTSDVANCAVAFAQQNAAQYGGDPARTVLDGFSAGVIPAMNASLEPAEEPIAGCATDTLPIPALGVVLGDGEYFLHDRQHDSAFVRDPTGMQAGVAGWLDPSNWPEDLKPQFFLWINTDGIGSNPRTFDAVDSGWFPTRDPDGSIAADLEQLGQLEDGVVSYMDTDQLLYQRMTDAGVVVTSDEYPGGHTTFNKLSEIVSCFNAAAGQ